MKNTFDIFTSDNTVLNIYKSRVGVEMSTVKIAHDILCKVNVNPSQHVFWGQTFLRLRCFFDIDSLFTNDNKQIQFVSKMSTIK